MKIIIVDDEMGGLANVKKAIEGAVPDVEIHTFSLPLQALEYFRSNVCEVAFLDVDMPQMNGIALAKELKKLNPHVNIIFVTAYIEYGRDAFKLRASGYLLKPITAKDVADEMRCLRYPVEEPEKGVYAVTFGQFDLWVDGEPLHFGRSKSKELLAYLIDRRGGGVTKKEIAAALFEDKEYTRSTQDYINKIVRELCSCLKEAGLEALLVKKHNYYAVDTSQFYCDLYAYEAGDLTAINAFKGEYMTQYSWGELTLGKLCQ